MKTMLWKYDGLEIRDYLFGISFTIGRYITGIHFRKDGIRLFAWNYMWEVRR